MASPHGGQDANDESPQVTVTAHVPSWVKDHGPLWVLVLFATYFVLMPMLKAVESMTQAVIGAVEVVKTHDLETKLANEQSHTLGSKIVTFLQINCLNQADDAKKRAKCVTGEIWIKGEPWP